MKHTELSTQQIFMALQYTTLRWTVALHWTSKITAEPGNQTGYFSFLSFLKVSNRVGSNCDMNLKYVNTCSIGLRQN